MITETVKLTTDQLSRISYVETSYSGLSTGSADLQYAEDGKQWIENEIFVRDSIEVELAAVENLIYSLDISALDAALYACVDLLSCEFDDTQDWVPECVAFSPVFD